MRAHAKWLGNIGACSVAVEFADTRKSLKAAWEACTRTDWMLWLLRKVKHDDPKAYRLFACWCVRNTPLMDGRTVWDLLADDRSKNAVIIAEKHANGEATDEELVSAGKTAWASAWAAAEGAAWDSARAAAWDSARAAWAAARAARAAAWDADAAGGAAWDAAWAAAGAAQAAKLREVFLWPMVEKSIINFKKGAK